MNFILLGVLVLFFTAGCETTKREVSAFYPVKYPVKSYSS